MGPTRTDGPQDAGFSVLEAMIAVFLLAVGFLPLLELQSRFVSTTEALERAEVRIGQRQLTENHLATINFALQPEGRARYGDTQVSWQATPLAPARTVRAAGGAPSRFTVSLWDVEVEALTVRGSFATATGQNAVPRVDTFGTNDAPDVPPALRYRRRGLGWTATQGVLDSF